MRAAVCCTQELVGPSNVEEVAAAARDSNTAIGVHLYLFSHYGDPWGWEFEAATELEVGSRASVHCKQPPSTRQMPCASRNNMMTMGAEGAAAAALAVEADKQQACPALTGQKLATCW